ncbi:MAG: hypothetical protein ACYTF6_05245 [Planctomycetota bacterium]|jgi:hypothetical protein
MDSEKKYVPAKVDGYTRFCLTAISVLLTVLIIALWAEGVPSADEARAEDPRLFGDSAAQREELTSLQQQTIAKLDELIALLRSGEAKVQLAQPGENRPGGKDVVPKASQ